MLSVYCCYDVTADWSRADVVLGALRDAHLRVTGHVDPGGWHSSAAALDGATRRLIDWHLYATEVTLVLVGRMTAGVRYVQYAVERSLARGNRLVGVHVHGIPDARGRRAERGLTPFVPPGTPFPTITWDTSLPWNTPAKQLLRQLNAAGHRAAAAPTAEVSPAQRA